MRIRIRPRRGITLTEVLIAIFVMAIGLLGILSLFPLGFVTMAQAIKDDRCALANGTSTTLMRSRWHQEVGDSNAPVPYLLRDPFIHAMLDPVGGNLPAIRTVTPGPYVPNPYYSEGKPSYAVYLDPVGYWNPNNIGLPQQNWVGGDLSCIPRRSTQGINLSPNRALLINRNFVQLDDVGFGKDATPYNVSGNSTAFQTGGPLFGEVQRDGRFSWAYLIRQSRWSANLDLIPNSEADLYVIVYNGRSLDGPSDETVFDGTTFIAGSTEVLMPYPLAGVKPKVRKGTWILDGTMARQDVVNGATIIRPEPHGHFYRVISVNDDTPGLLILEIQQPAVASTVYANNTPYGKCVLMDFVAEVFERRTLTRTTVPVP